MRKPEISLPDTNTFVRYLINDDPLQFKQARDFFDKVKNAEIRALILESVIAESIYVLLKIYKAPRDKAAVSIIEILRYKGIINKDKQEFIQALTLFAGQKLDIVDCLLYARAKSAGYRLVTFDSGLNKLMS